MFKMRMIGLAAAIVHSTAAYASMPMLTPSPQDNTVRACASWAREQDEEAIDMWGMQQSGGSSYELGIHRLTSQCLGEPVSDIVGSGSSLGFDDEYCAKHHDAAVCS
jgi:hypothetical protein